VLLQRRGAAGFVILTVPFGDQMDRVMAYQNADRPIPPIVIEHPTQNISPDEAELRAHSIADAVERILRRADVP